MENELVEKFDKVIENLYYYCYTAKENQEQCRPAVTIASIRREAQ